MPAETRDFVTVVSGVPRSGTSLLMQMLAAGGLPPLSDATRGADAHNPRGYFEYAPVRRLPRDASWLAAAEGRAVKVIHARVPALPPGPAYRVVLVRRDLREVVASQDAMLGDAAPPGPDAGRLAAIFAEELAELERCCARRQIPLLELAYADVLRDPAGAAARLARFLGGGLDEAAMARAVDPSLRHHRAANEGVE